MNGLTIICTSGTSISGGRLFDGDEKGYRVDIQRRLQELERNSSDGNEYLQLASAETNSLLSLEAGQNDTVILLSTETPEGRICAEECGALLTKHRNVNFEVVQIEGLQVDNVTRFRRIGIQKLFEVLDLKCGNSHLDNSGKVTLNVTGGFKSIVPYVALYGLLHQLPVVYLFERSKTLLRLPALPINFDYERLGQAMDAIELLHREGALPKEQFFEAIPGLNFHGREWYECLLEEENSYVTLSTFGSIFTRLRSQEQVQVFIGPSANQAYNLSNGFVRDQFSFMLERVADPLWRRGKIHPFIGTDLTVFKPGNTGERMACVIRGTKIYVCELFRHDEYERSLPSKRVSQYRFNEFEPWARPANKASPPSTEEEAFRVLRERYEETLNCWKTAEEQFENVKKERATLRSEADDLRLKVTKVSEELSKAHNLAAESERRLSDQISTIKRLENELVLLRKPWWVRLFRTKAPPINLK